MKKRYVAKLCALEAKNTAWKPAKKASYLLLLE